MLELNFGPENDGLEIPDLFENRQIPRDFQNTRDFHDTRIYSSFQDGELETLVFTIRLKARKLSRFSKPSRLKIFKTWKYSLKTLSG